MAKITLGQRPKSFTKTVKFDMLDGSKGSIEVTYKYRTRTEFGEFIDKFTDGKAKPDQDGKFSMGDYMQQGTEANADYLLQVVDAWNLDAELTRANAMALADEIPAAAIAIMETYRLAIIEGRLGN